MVLNVHINHEVHSGQGEGRGREGAMEVGGEETMYLSLHCHHQNDFCIKVGRDESHFNVY